MYTGILYLCVISLSTIVIEHNIGYRIIIIIIICQTIITIIVLTIILVPKESSIFI